uniref:Uncharacterized protein n=1 Tax=Anguilla anguilla TaxID=7936 RepID=A0A0E9TN48_ANGAN
MLKYTQANYSQLTVKHSEPASFILRETLCWLTVVILLGVLHGSMSSVRSI